MMSLSQLTCQREDVEMASDGAAMGSGDYEEPLKSSFLQGNDTPRNHTSWENNNMKFLDMLSTEVSLLLVSKVVESEGIDLKC